MRKIIVLSMITLDGVMQAPGAPGEDTSDGFKYGGWVAPYDDEVGGKLMQKHISGYKEVELNTGLSHGFFYKGRKVWIDPIIEWFDKNTLKLSGVFYK